MLRDVTTGGKGGAKQTMIIRIIPNVTTASYVLTAAALPSKLIVYIYLPTGTESFIRGADDKTEVGDVAPVSIGMTATWIGMTITL